MTPKRAKFVSEYLKDFNATQAALRAGYSQRNANVVGPRLLVSVGIAEAVARSVQKARSAAIMTLEEALEVASRGARGDDGNARWSDRTRCLERLAKMSGWDKPATLDITSGGQPLRTEIVVRARDVAEPDEESTP